MAEVNVTTKCPRLWYWIIMFNLQDRQLPGQEVKLSEEHLRQLEVDLADFCAPSGTSLHSSC